MDPVTMMAVMAAVGAAKSELIDAPRAERQRKLAAQTALYSPWTGMTPDKVQEADPFGSTLQGATAGAMYGQAQQQNELAQKELEMKKPFYDSFNKDAAPASPALGGSAGQPSAMSSDLDFRRGRMKQPYMFAQY